MFNLRAAKNEDGQATTELALIAIPLCVILFGIFQFGIVFKDYLALTDGVRAGARKAAVSRHENFPVQETTEAVEDSAAGLDDDLEVTVTSTWNHGDEVKVEGTYPYKINLFGWVASEGRLSSVTKERVE